ncbi:MAG: sigma-E processing peptidase SpoIIGA, partial [Clostridia bacterium]|nr:sigma-E processing peptidase SpoIIGA [Clostridia bacterium]
FVLIKFLKHYLKHKQARCSTYDVTITIDGKKYYIRGFLDSGNRLYDDNKPIVVISFACFCKMFKNFPFDKIMLDRVSGVDLKNAHYINVVTATSSAKMLVFNCDSIQICHDDINIQKSNVAMGVSKKNFSQFECLLHEGLL